ncbi:MAG TPA: HAMP domain-containing sensor histidine kinase [Solirubrobacteraceae bacterium]|nr:HAMP domain-containing sensor histidine kinase [Solirubrobacteraceae bacterium]
MAPAATHTRASHARAGSHEQEHTHTQEPTDALAPHSALAPSDAPAPNNASRASASSPKRESTNTRGEPAGPTQKPAPRARASSPEREHTGTRTRRLGWAFAALGAYLAIYLSWQLWHWLPGKQQLGQAFLLPPDALALAVALLAARRCGAAPRLRSFWLLMSAAIAAELIADALLLRNVAIHVKPPFPTPADPFFLAFYMLLLAALLRVPVAKISFGKRLQMAIDGATIVIGGGAVVWYLVLGPTAEAGGQDTLATAVSVAYPMGDLILLAGLAAVLLRSSPAILRTPLLLIAAGMSASIVADAVYGYGVLHGTYTNGDPIDTLYVAEFLLFALAAIAQLRPGSLEYLGPGDPNAIALGQGDQNAIDPFARAREWRQPAPRASWLPYVSVATAFGILFGVELEGPFFPNVSLVLIAAVLAALVATRQYLAQRELVQAQAALRESERVKDEFLSIAGHELRTPLTSIRGSLGLLEAGVLGPLPGDAANMVAIALVNTDRLVRLVNDVLDVERMAAGGLKLHLVKADAGELVEQSLQAIRASADAAGVRLCAHAAPIAVLADPDRVVQVLVNLIGNAVKFSEPGGVVDVTVAGDEEGALFSVHDTGRGIPEDSLANVFERFRQVDASDARERGGTGLGLPIARGIVEQHGGRIWVDSAVGEGSTFRFTLLPAETGLEASPAMYRDSLTGMDLSAPTEAIGA